MKKRLFCLVSFIVFSFVWQVSAMKRAREVPTWPEEDGINEKFSKYLPTELGCMVSREILKDPSFQSWIYQLMHIPLVGVLNVCNNAIDVLSVSKDGAYLVAAAKSDTLAYLIDIEKKEVVHTFVHSGRVRLVMFSSDGMLLATGLENGTVMIWCTQTGECIQEISAHNTSIIALAFSSNSEYIATGAVYSCAKVWHTRTGHCQYQLARPTIGVQAIAFNSDGSKIVTGSLSGSIAVWSTENGMLLHNKSDQNSRFKAVSCAFSSDSQHIVIQSQYGDITTWNPETNQVILGQKGDRNYQFTSLSSDYYQRMVGGGFNRIHLSTTQMGNTVRLVPPFSEGPCSAPVNIGIFSPDDKTIVLGLANGRILIGDISVFTLLKKKSFRLKDIVHLYSLFKEQYWSGARCLLLRLFKEELPDDATPMDIVFSEAQDKA